MNDLKGNENLEGQLQFSLDLGKSPEEQVFSNGVLVDHIWKHLPTQDIIQNALVSRAWHAKSRETLRSTENKRAVYIYIDNDSPCRTLAKFNALLEDTSRGTTLNNPMPFNEIQLLANRWPSSADCRNCLKNEWLVNINGEWNPAQEQIVTDNLPQIFGSVLGKFQLKYFRVYAHLTQYCPFVCFIKHFFRTEPEKILELDFGIDLHISHFSSQDVLRGIVPNNEQLVEFPNLEVFGWCSVDFYTRTLIIVAPSLKKITHYTYNSVYSERLRLELAAFPRHAITQYSMQSSHPQSITETLEVFEEFHPIIEVLSVGGTRNPKDITAEDVFKLGEKASATLKKLTCSPLILSLLVTKMGAENTENGKQNRFPHLETMDLCYINKDALDWLNCVDVNAVFPKLQEVHLGLGRALNYDSAVNGPDNLFIGSHQFDGVKRLILTSGLDNVHSVERACHWLNLFRNIQELNLTGMRFKYDGDDRLFDKLLSEIGNLQFLKIVTIAPPDLLYFCFDHLFSENYPKMKILHPGANLAHVSIYQSSILYHKSLEQVNIQGEKICTSKIINTGETRCYSIQAPGTFLVSAEIARVICKHRPGFKFCLTIRQPCKPECTSGFWPGGFRLEHLEPFTAINYRQSRAGMYVTRFWEIEFLGLACI